MCCRCGRGRTLYKRPFYYSLFFGCLLFLSFAISFIFFSLSLSVQVTLRSPFKSIERKERPRLISLGKKGERLRRRRRQRLRREKTASLAFRFSIFLLYGKLSLSLYYHQKAIRHLLTTEDRRKTTVSIIFSLLITLLLLFIFRPQNVFECVHRGIEECSNFNVREAEFIWPIWPNGL